ncbi:uncharacterized protein LOC117899725 [Drosophila subobscura]|uniref:uncharacterized protein LOC117899725 n=1 Tax=Drosophila subobscura TaxID=7241 RepID=UPI00155A9230|nr:uncharacterized protein LOC117899725 [Drosophila subobscura]
MRYLIMGLLTLIFVIIFFSVGGYYTLQHPKQKRFKACYSQGGTCREEDNCEDQFKSDFLTLCVLKICCLSEVPIKSGEDYD